ncbi:MAG: 50S ribosomal protein L24 [Clostridia bacterium]|nr:50S ribosomal protein L24 [Clostridia bacterium]
MANNVHVKVDDTVIVLSGKYKNTVGKVLAVSPEEGKVIVKGVNIVKKHTKPRRQGETGGILEVEGAIYASKVQLVCSNSKCEKNGKGVRAKYTVVDGKKIRVCAKCGKEI